MDSIEMLDLIRSPAFCVQNNTVIRINQAASQCGIAENMEISQLLPEDCDDYAGLRDGCLYLTLTVNGIPWGTDIWRFESFDVFILEQEQAELQSLALASQQLREPLSSIMSATDQLFSADLIKNDDTAREQAAQINQGLFRILRLLGNMSDAGKYQKISLAQQETCEIGAFFDEILAKVQALAERSGRKLNYTGINKRIYCLADKEKLERAIYNLLSNAIKYSPAESEITAKVSTNRNKLYFTVQDSGSGISKHLRTGVFARYLREPGIEDGRHGMGLGMLLIRSAAAAHNGTVLIEQPEFGGTRVTMSLTIRQSKFGTVRSDILSVDYAGERDHALIELSDVLPAASFENIN